MKNIHCVLAGLLAILAANPVLAAFLDVPDEYPTIQAAVNHSADGDTIRLRQGLYQENIVLDFSRTIVIEGGWNADFSERELNPQLTRLEPGSASGLSGVTVDAGNGETLSMAVRGLSVRNGGTGTGGGVSVSAGSGGSASLTLEGSALTENSAGLGGGVYSRADGGTVAVSVLNTLIAGNIAPAGGMGGGFYCEAVNGGNLQLTLTHATITGNEGSQAAGGLFVSAQGASRAHVSITNTILWGNAAPSGAEISMEQAVGAQLTVNTSYSDIGTSGISIQAGTYNSLGGNIDEDPLFLNPLERDYHLEDGSPCMDRGTGTNTLRTDFEGSPRPFGMGVDIGADEAAPQEATLRSRILFGTNDGTVFSYGGVMGTEIAVGDRGGNDIARGFISFDVSTIPPGSTVKTALLRMYQAGVNFTPYVDLGSVAADHLMYGSSLGAEAFEASSLQADIGTLCSSADLGWKELDVTAAVQGDIDRGRAFAQFRLRFTPRETDGDGDSDQAVFDASGAFGGPAHVAELRVTFGAHGETVLPVPSTQGQPWSHPVPEHPEIAQEPNLCRPFAVGTPSAGTITFQVALPAFAGPVDVYLGIYAPQAAPDLYTVTPEHGLVPSSEGVVRWRTENAEPVEEVLFGGEISTSGLPDGIYTLYCVVTPPGTVDAFYFWVTAFELR